MPRPIAIESDAAEQRVYHAQLITCLAVIPTLMGLATLGTAVAMGDRDLRGIVLAHPFGLMITGAIALLFLLAWWLQGRRHRAGVLLAAALFAWMLASSVDRSIGSYLDIAFAIVGLVLVARAWPAMRGPARPATSEGST